MRFRLHLTEEQLDILRDVLNSYDWLCNCPDFPNCRDFQIFCDLVERVKTLKERALRSKIYGAEGLAKRDEIKQRALMESLFKV